MTTAEIGLLLQAREFRAAKALGQNFLMDDDVLERIANAARLDGRCVLEIGAGAGCLTRYLAERARCVLAVEIDTKLLPVLETVLLAHHNIELLPGDALRLDLNAECERAFGGETYAVAANLPYGITSAIVTRFIRMPKARDLTLMMQKEAAERLLAAPGGKEYGPLAVLCAYLYESETLFDVPPHCFRPQPHVDSAVIRFTRRPESDTTQQEALSRLLQTCFLMRRKTLLNNLGAAMGREMAATAIEKAGLQPGQRAETLSLKDYLRLLENE